MTHAGRTVLFSAATVACALATLTVFPQGFLKSMGIAGAIVALVAALAALTITPGAARPVGHQARPRSASGHRPGDRARAAGTGSPTAVMRHPGAIAAVTAAVMLAAALPALRNQCGRPPATAR